MYLLSVLVTTDNFSFKRSRNAIDFLARLHCACLFCSNSIINKEMSGLFCHRYSKIDKNHIIINEFWHVTPNCVIQELYK